MHCNSESQVRTMWRQRSDHEADACKLATQTIALHTHTRTDQRVTTERQSLMNAKRAHAHIQHACYSSGAALFGTDTTLHDLGATFIPTRT